MDKFYQVRLMGYESLWKEKEQDRKEAVKAKHDVIGVVTHTEDDDRNNDVCRT